MHEREEHHHIHIHIHADELLQQFFRGFLNEFHSLIKKVDHIVTTQTELAAQLTALKDQLSKASGEITAKIAALEDAVNNAGSVTPEVEAALADAKAAAQALDDIVPDAP